MLRSITLSQWLEWRAYDAKHPIGDLRLEVEFARLRHSIAAIVEGDKTPELHEFMWSWVPDDEERALIREQVIEQKILRAFGVA